MWKFLRFSLFGLALIPGVTRAQLPAETKPQPAEDQLRERVKTFYQDILKNDRLGALELVATESKNQFLNNRYEGLEDFRISSIDSAPAGDRATVKVVRLIRATSSAQTFEVNFVDTWQLIDGQWFFVLPPPGEMDTPFGRIKFDPNNKPSDAEVQEMKARLEKAYKNVDPDQYIRALQNAINTTSAEPKSTDKPSQEGAAASKPESKKPTTPPPTDTSRPPN